MPCFPKDRRLAEVFMRGGAQAEAQERITIREEEQAAREKSRQVHSFPCFRVPASVQSTAIGFCSALCRFRVKL